MDPSELISLKEQVADLDSALQSDPNNEDLLTLKTELLDLISLTETLLQQEQQLTEPEPVAVEASSPVALAAGRVSSSSSSPYMASTESGSGASTPTAHRPSTTTTAALTSSSKQPIFQPAHAPTRTWAVGDRCRAMYADDGKYYEATILGVGTGATGGQVYSLQYTGYADSPPINLSAEYLKPIYEKKHHHTPDAAASAGEGEGAGGAKAGQKRGLDGAPGAVPGSGAAIGGGLKKKKKDAGPNEQVQKQMAWQNFAKGGGKKGAKTGAGIKKSIFATPDNPEGKVGVVGSGKGMTQFQQRGKHLYGSTPDSQ